MFPIREQFIFVLTIHMCSLNKHLCNIHYLQENKMDNEGTAMDLKDQALVLHEMSSSFFIVMNRNQIAGKNEGYSTHDSQYSLWTPSTVITWELVRNVKYHFPCQSYRIRTCIWPDPQVMQINSKV